MRLGVLWTELSGYINACLSQLYDNDVELFVSHFRKKDSLHLYQKEMFSWIDKQFIFTTGAKKELLAAFKLFNPDVILISGWAIREYLEIAEHFKGLGVPVIATCDTPWRGTVRQYVASLIAHWYLHPKIDVLWVPGERAAFFGRQLGFTGQRLWRGLYTADTNSLFPVADWRISQDLSKGWPKRFIFIGRMVPEKGIHNLVLAYKKYRQNVDEPWELWCAGVGTEASIFENQEGVKLLGFVQPSDYPNILRSVGTFILPSVYEPWGVVVHEAMASGLPVLVSSRCGCSVELVQDGYNGFTFDPLDVNYLSELMFFISTEADLTSLGRASYHLAQRYSPQLWSEQFLREMRSMGME